MIRFLLVVHRDQETLPMSDPPLSIEGWEQGYELGRDLAKEEATLTISSIISSMAARALQTAVPISFELGLPIIPSEAFTVETNRAPDGTIYGGPVKFAFKQQEVIAWLREYAARHQGSEETVLIVTHLPIMGVVLAYLEGITEETAIEEWFSSHTKICKEPITLSYADGSFRV